MDEADRPATFFHLALARLFRPRALRVNYNLQNLAAPAYRRRHHRLWLRLNRGLLQGTIAAGSEAEAVLRGHGFSAPRARIPLFASETIFRPAAPGEKADLRRRFGAPGACILLVYAGSLSRAKGVDLLLTALPKIPGLYLLLAGNGELEKEAAALPSRCGRHLGALGTDRLRELYQSGDYVILPSRDTPAWKEQVGRVLLEGILCGCLGLGSDSGFIPELLGTPETVFPQGDADALEVLLRRLPLPQAGRLWENQRNRVRERFSAQSVARATADFFKGLTPGEKP
jgi:glycosyltransferase involved in cell wall biosynthesis